MIINDIYLPPEMVENILKYIDSQALSRLLTINKSIKNICIRYINYLHSKENRKFEDVTTLRNLIHPSAPLEALLPSEKKCAGSPLTLFKETIQLKRRRKEIVEQLPLDFAELEFGKELQPVRLNDQKILRKIITISKEKLFLKLGIFNFLAFPLCSNPPFFSTSETSEAKKQYISIIIKLPSTDERKMSEPLVTCNHLMDKILNTQKIGVKIPVELVKGVKEGEIIILPIACIGHSHVCHLKACQQELANCYQPIMKKIPFEEALAATRPYF